LRPSARPFFSLAWEKLESLRADGIEDLLIEDWMEIETDRDRIFYDPDWERSRTLEKQGYLRILVARDRRRRVVGYNAFCVMPMLHSRRAVQATNDVIWAAPEWRARLGVRLIVEAERHLKTLGAIRITYASKTHLALFEAATGGRLGRLLRRLGYQHIEAVYAKVI
jgi:GNAT superfamily N-acetyltransferase